MVRCDAMCPLSFVRSGRVGGWTIRSKTVDGTISQRLAGLTARKNWFFFDFFFQRSRERLDSTPTLQLSLRPAPLRGPEVGGRLSSVEVQWRAKGRRSGVGPTDARRENAAPGKQKMREKRRENSSGLIWLCGVSKPKVQKERCDPAQQQPTGLSLSCSGRQVGT